MVLEQDGTVLAAGGDYWVAADTEIFDPSSQSWRLTGSLQQGRDSNTATLLQDGRVLVAGGEITGPPCDNEGGGCTTTVFASAELFTPTAGS
jgi:hypothetical protein